MSLQQFYLCSLGCIFPFILCVCTPSILYVYVQVFVYRVRHYFFRLLFFIWVGTWIGCVQILVKFGWSDFVLFEVKHMRVIVEAQIELYDVLVCVCVSHGNQTKTDQEKKNVKRNRSSESSQDVFSRTTMLMTTIHFTTFAICAGFFFRSLQVKVFNCSYCLAARQKNFSFSFVHARKQEMRKSKKSGFQLVRLLKIKADKHFFWYFPISITQSKL